MSFSIRILIPSDFSMNVVYRYIDADMNTTSTYNVRIRWFVFWFTNRNSSGCCCKNNKFINWETMNWMQLLIIFVTLPPSSIPINNKLSAPDRLNWMDHSDRPFDYGLSVQFIDCIALHFQWYISTSTGVNSHRSEYRAPLSTIRFKCFKKDKNLDTPICQLEILWTLRASIQQHS